MYILLDDWEATQYTFAVNTKVKLDLVVKANKEELLFFKLSGGR